MNCSRSRSPKPRRKPTPLPPSRQSLVVESIVKQLMLYAARRCRWTAVGWDCIYDDSWRPIVEVLATSAGSGWYAPCQTATSWRLRGGCGRCDLLVGAMCTDGVRAMAGSCFDA